MVRHLAELPGRPGQDRHQNQHQTLDNPTLGQMLAAVNHNGIASGTSTVGHLHAGVLSACPTFGYTSNRAGFKPDEFNGIDYAILTEVDPTKQQQA
jgi:hypothetical protein